MRGARRWRRHSVLIGPAGTGKTTLLRALCTLAPVQEGGVLLLAPTGKARVRMEQQVSKVDGVQAKTIASSCYSCAATTGRSGATSRIRRRRRRPDSAP